MNAYLHNFIPTAANNDGVDWVRAEPHAADPFGVTLVFDVVLALAECVPQLDGLVSATRDNLSVVGREGDGKDIGSVPNEAAGSCASVEVPETESFVPRCGEGELTVGGDDDVRNEVVVPMQDFFSGNRCWEHRCHGSFARQ